MIDRTLKSEFGCNVRFADPLAGTDPYDEVLKMDTDADWKVDGFSTSHGIIVFLLTRWAWIWMFWVDCANF